MADSNIPSRPSPYPSSSALASASQSTGSGSVRSRNRRPISSNDDRSGHRSTDPSSRNPDLLSISRSSTDRQGRSQSSRWPNVSPSRNAGTASLGQFLGESWTQSWSSVHGFATSLLSTGEDRSSMVTSLSRNRPQNSVRSDSWGDKQSGSKAGSNLASWGPAPPSHNPGLYDVAAGSSADREAALKAARTASVLESYEGVNGGLDVAGKYKHRKSDEIAPDTTQQEEYLVYIHKVQPTDTYAGIILRYKCREDAFRKANGLWSRDSIQMRKWLTIPVDACEVRGRTCEAPSGQRASSPVDLLISTPPVVDERHDFFGQPANGEAAGKRQAEREDRSWAHVRWVKIDSLSDPVEIGRVARQSMGYFPPRRKKSIRTTSSPSTPRQSSDFSSSVPAPVERPSSRRHNSLSSQPQLPGSPTLSRDRMGSDGVDSKPVWMRRPGGVGSMGRNVRAPGPEKDYFNAWARKHLPGLNIDDLPSMSVMGSETAHFGFANKSTSIVESPFEGGRDAISVTRQGNGLDKAAAAVETWLRGALAKRPTTPLIGGLPWQGGRPTGGDGGDLIELSYTASDDGKPHPEPTINIQSLAMLGKNDKVGVEGLKGKKAD